MPTSVAAEDVVIRRDALPWQLPNGSTSGRHLHLTADEAYLAWDRIGVFRVRNGNEIVYSPHPDVDEAMIRLPLLGIVFAALLHQRGYLVLHGSVLVSEGQAITFLGHKGDGKSTLAAALRRSGYAFVSDDTAALDMQASDGPIVLPGFPHQKLWPDALAALGENTNGLARLYESIEKRHYPITEPYVSQSVPLKAVYILAGGEQLEIAPLSPQEAVIQLLPHLSMAPFGNQLLQTRDTAHFLQCADLARRIPVYLLKRPYNLGLLDQTIEIVKAHAQAHTEPEPA